MPTIVMKKSNNRHAYGRQRCTKQFWKAGEYEGAPPRTSRNKIDSSSTSGFDHARMHPKFLHSNATSHKWALGAFAELLDNALDEVHNGATYVNIDVHSNKKDGSKMLLVQDNGGGMDPEKMRKCMSLGYSEKSKMADTIGQYGNGFKTSTMRLGADVIVFSRTERTQSIGLLSYTFLRSTGKEDTVVPMVDYEKRRGTETWTRMFRSSSENWDKNLETIIEWSPFESEEDLKRQFTMMNARHGTRIIIYNLWEDDEGNLELDLDSEPHDIQMRGVNRDEKSIEMAEKYPNSRHFLTYRHSLRSYASILYLRLPTNFRIILRGRDVKHHNILSDLMWSEQVTYRPKVVDKEEAYMTRSTKKEKDTNMVAKVTLGFVKDAENHLDVQGFNVYHRNRLITPFWRVWNAAGSDGRGVIGVIEADYINPAHDKQGFEHTILLDRLKQKIAESQKLYWSTNCHKIGYAPRRNKRAINEEREAANKSGNQSRPALDSNPDKSSSRKRPLPDSDTNAVPQKSQKVSSDKSPNGNGNMHKKNTQATTKSSTRRPDVVLGLNSSKPHANIQKPSSATAKTSPGVAKTKVATSDKQANHKITDKAATKSSENADEVVNHSNMEEDSQYEQESTPCVTDSPVTTTSGASNTTQELRAQLQKANEESKKQNMQQDKGARQQKDESSLLKKEIWDAYNKLQKAHEEIKKLNMQQEESTRRHQEENNLNSLLKKEIWDAYNKLQKANEEIKKLNIQQDERAQRQKEENSFLKKELQNAYDKLRKANEENSALIELLQEEREKMQHSTRKVFKM